jgi:hypothetical protein
MLIKGSGASRLAGFILLCIAHNSALVYGQQMGVPPAGHNEDAWGTTNRNKFATIEVDASGGISGSKPSSPMANDYYMAPTNSRRLPVESTEGSEIEGIIAISLVVVAVVGIGLLIRSRSPRALGKSVDPSPYRNMAKSIELFLYLIYIYICVCVYE